MNKDRITPEEKEMLRRLMETPGIEKDWDFFQDLNMDVPPPEFFMRGKSRSSKLVWVIVAAAVVGAIMLRMR